MLASLSNGAPDPSIIDLSSLGLAGVTIYGAESTDNSGLSVNCAGDVNGDGFEDLLIGASFADALNNDKPSAGETYLIFGKANWAVTPTLDLLNLGTNGVTIFGADAFDYSGRSVSGLGDVNGDGFDDILIGANRADAADNGKQDAGESYLVFGKADWSNTSTIDLFDLGTAGVKIFGAEASDFTGFSVSDAGDVNGDGLEDLLIGAWFGDGANNTRLYAGDTYVVFGKADMSLTPTIDLSSLGSAGITIFGAETNDFSGRSVSSAGDLNGDGFDDLFIGAFFADGANNAKPYAGESYVVFGKGDWSTTPTIDLLNLASAGVTIYGAEANDFSGSSVSSAGDVNGDGFDDLLIGAPGANASDNSKAQAGNSYLIFGMGDWSATPTIDLFNLGSAGITIFGADPGDRSGSSLRAAGDVNGDGFDDMIVGAYRADASNNLKTLSGDSYVIFGKADWSSTPTIDLFSLGSTGITIFGADAYDQSGFSVNSAGDVNGDGFADLLIGAPGGDGSINAKSNSGETYILFGGNQFTNSLMAANLGNVSADVIDGTAAANLINGAGSNDTLVGNGGADVLTGGQGNDILAISDLSFKRIVGGTGYDVLRLDGSGLALDLTIIPDNRILDIEEINIIGNGLNSLTLNQREVLNLSSAGNKLVVRRDAGDTVNFGPGWTQGFNQAIGSDAFSVYTQGVATLFVQLLGLDTTPPSVTSIIAGGSAWSPAFIDAVDGEGAGAGNGLGYALTSNLTLPNSGIDRIYIQFSEPVVGFNASKFLLNGVNIPDYSIPPGAMTVSYDAINRRGVIQLSSPMTKDKLRIGVSDAVMDPSMNALDGDSDTFAGGVLDFRFNVLVGDANNDGSVNGGDLPSFAASFNKSTGNAAYNSRADWNSDGSVNGGDLPLFANNFNKSLPASEPGALIFPPPIALMETEVLYAPAIDEEDADKFFAQIETDEDLSNFEARYSYESLTLT